MGCQYKDKCPGHSGQCNHPKQDFETCIPFLIGAYEYKEKSYQRLRKRALRIIDELNLYIENMEGEKNND